MGDVLDFCARKQTQLVKDAAGRFGEVLWADFFTDEDGMVRVAFEAILIEAVLPQRALRELEVSLANFKEVRGAKLYLPVCEVLEAPDGILHFRGVSQPVEAFQKDPVTLSLKIGVQFVVYPLAWKDLRKKAPKAKRA